VSTIAAAVEAQGVDLTAATESGYTNYQKKVYIQAYYDKPGTYVYTIFDDATDDGYVSGADVSTTFTVVVADSATNQTLTGTASAINSSSATSTSYGSLVKIGLKDASGNAASPDLGSGVKVTVSGSAVVDRVNNTNTTNAATYTLGNGDFNGSGFAWINVTNTVAESVTLTLSGTGGLASSFTAPAAIVLTFADAAASTGLTLAPIATGSGIAVTQAAAADTTAGTGTASKTGTSVSLKTGNTTASKKDVIKVTDTDGVLTGKSSAVYEILVA